MNLIINDTSVLNMEQNACLSCACDNCFRLFGASTRTMQDNVSRTKAFEQMNKQDIELQKRFLNKQLSTVVELLGV